MLEYYRKIKDKLPVAFAICFLLLYILFIVIFIVIAITRNNFSEFFNLKANTIFIGASLSISIFVFIFAFFVTYFEYKQQEDLLNLPPFNAIQEYGFQRVILLKNSYWALYRDAYYARCGNYIVLVDRYAKNKLAFTILTRYTPDVNLQLPQEYRELELTKNQSGIALVIPTQSFWTPSVKETMSLIQRIVNVLIKNEVAPEHGFSRYERMLKEEMIRKGLMAGLGS